MTNTIIEAATLSSETDEPALRPPRPRRQLLLGAGATASLIVTLVNRPAFAAKTCNHSTWISWKGELTHPSQEPTPCTGDSPATWAANAASLWAPSWGNAYLTTTQFTTIFPAVTINTWSINGTDTLLSALQGNISVHQRTTQKLPVTFPQHAVAALLNINFYGDKYGTVANAQTTASLISEVASDLPRTFATAQTDINNFIAKYSALNSA
jgi:hypothetical protein